MTARKIVYHVHLYLGLGAGGLIALIGLTGSAIVFGPENDRLLNPHLLREVPVGEPMGLQAALTAARKAYPDRDPLLIGIPASPDARAEGAHGFCHECIPWMVLREKRERYWGRRKHGCDRATLSPVNMRGLLSHVETRKSRV